MESFIKCFFGPRLIRIYASSGRDAVNYVPNRSEKVGDYVIQLMNRCLQIGIYASPILIWILYKKNCLCHDSIFTLMKITVLCTSLCAASTAIRAFGRFRRSEYLSFINDLETVKANYNPQTKKLLRRYDFDFQGWPIEFSWKDIEKDADKPRMYIDKLHGNRSIAEFAHTLPCQMVAYLVAKSFGIRILYPGTIMQYFIDTHLVDGRSRLIEEHGGQRHKLEARDGNHIDTIFVDRRSTTGYANGDMLVICCEGNAGFYEIGMAITPLEAEYSVLGWNHPGFGGSTGAPFPEHEQNAVDIVVQFALNKLNFPPERIIIYGWSIGGFTASWAAMNYPNIRAVILDATFDHVLPLAANVMPTSWNSLVAATIGHYMNLNVAEQIIKYPGPVLLVRRVRDEIIALEPGTVSTNRGNDLLIKLLKFRFPRVIDQATMPIIREWLAADLTERKRLEKEQEVNEDVCARRVQNFIDEHSSSFPMTLGQDWTEREKIQMALYLAAKYMWDFDSNHCTPLPGDFFSPPRELGLESDFVEDASDVQVEVSVRRVVAKLGDGGQG